MNDDQIKSILRKSKVIAMIGVSSEKKGEDKKNLKRKPANVVMKYMQNFGYKVIPINPFAVGEVVNGEPMVESLDKVKEDIDIVDVFRPSNEAEGIAKEAIQKGTKVLWLQYGIHSDEAEAIAIANDTLYGLGAGVWSRDANVCYRMGRAIEAGRVWVNCYHSYPAHAAFGGYKNSGIGRETHKMMLNHYQQTKNVLVSYAEVPDGFF